MPIKSVVCFGVFTWHLFDIASSIKRGFNVDGRAWQLERRLSMAEGIVKWFNPDKGYGFISREDGDDLFVHFSEIQMEGFKTLNQDDKVQFEITTGQNGKLQASNVVRV